MLMRDRWIEDTLKDNDAFDVKGLIEADPARKERLKFWNNELCRKKPHTFDIVVAVRTHAMSLDLTDSRDSLAEMVLSSTVLPYSSESSRQYCLSRSAR